MYSGSDGEPEAGSTRGLAAQLCAGTCHARVTLDKLFCLQPMRGEALRWGHSGISFSIMDVFVMSGRSCAPARSQKGVCVCVCLIPQEPGSQEDVCQPPRRESEPHFSSGAPQGISLDMDRDSVSGSVCDTRSRLLIGTPKPPSPESAVGSRPTFSPLD